MGRTQRSQGRSQAAGERGAPHRKKTKEMAKTHMVLLAALACAPLLSGGPGQETVVASQATPNWIWLGPATDNQEVVFRRTFDVPGTPVDAVISGSCDNRMIVLINGERVGIHGRWEQVVSRDVSDALSPGENTLEVRARNEGGVAGLALRLAFGDGREIVTDASWQAAIPQRAVRNKWSEVTVIGPVGAVGLPWSGQVTLASYATGGGELRTDDPGGSQAPRAAEKSWSEQVSVLFGTLGMTPGFCVWLIYHVLGQAAGGTCKFLDLQALLRAVAR